MRNVWIGSAAFALGGLIGGSILCAPVWTRTRVTYHAVPPPCTDPSRARPTAHLAGLSAKVERRPFWDSDLCLSLGRK